MLDNITKFISRLECRDGAQIPSVHMDKSEYHAYKGDRYGILTINSKGMIEDIKYLQHFEDVSEIRSFVKSLGKNYVGGMIRNHTVSCIIIEADYKDEFEEIIEYLEFEEIIEYLEEDYSWEG